MSHNVERPRHHPERVLPKNGNSVVVVRGDGLTIPEVMHVASGLARAQLTADGNVLARVQASAEYVRTAVEANEPIYGITTLFGGMSDRPVPPTAATALQRNLVWSHKTGVGAPLPKADVRAAMLLRAHALMRGASGIRLTIIERLIAFLNADATPIVHEFGSIGASGDLVPLAYIAGAITGLDPSYRISFRGQEMDAPSVLTHLGLAPIELAPKEGLALMNGTSVMTGIAANVAHRTWRLLGLTMGTHALMFQGLYASDQALHPFIHRQKPHAGQRWVAARMLDLLAGSQLIRHELDGHHDIRHNDLIQDRYSIRCLPQYLGPMVDGIARISRDVTTEMNAATDNPLIDVDTNMSLHGGNFLGQYIGVAMDQMRYHIGLLAKHLDVQISLLVAPEFNGGLPASLVGNPQSVTNVGLKALQLCGNSIMPLLSHLGSSLADRFPTHAEQFNQNINSQGFGSANLARRSVEVFEQYMAVALLFAVQAADLRAFAVTGGYDATGLLSEPSRRLYSAVRAVLGQPPQSTRPLVWDDQEQFLDSYVAAIAEDITTNGQTVASIQEIVLDYVERFDLDSAAE